MRLIDADELPVTPIDITDLPTDKCLMVYLKEDIDDAETVKSIPLSVIEKIKAEIDTLNCIVRTKECHLLINDILDIIDQAIKECDT